MPPGTRQYDYIKNETGKQTMTDKIHCSRAGIPFIRVKPGKVQPGDHIRGVVVHDRRAVTVFARVTDDDIREGHLYGLRNVGIDSITYCYKRP